jgi:hypothetical protein
LLRADVALHAVLGISRFPVDDTIRNLFKRFGDLRKSIFLLPTVLSGINCWTNGCPTINTRLKSFPGWRGAELSLILSNSLVAALLCAAGMAFLFGPIALHRWSSMRLGQILYVRLAVGSFQPVQRGIFIRN